MIGQMIVLLRVKELKQDQAFRAMRAKRTELEEATLVTQQADARVRESEATLEAREDAIYAEVLGQVVDLGGVDETRGKVVQLEKDHERLKDALERAAHVQARLEAEYEKVYDHYRQCLKVRDKYVIITDEMKKEVEETANAKEETEVEDLYTRPRQKVS
jgi:hypothetical protein